MGGQRNPTGLTQPPHYSEWGLQSISTSQAGRQSQTSCPIRARVSVSPGHPRAWLLQTSEPTAALSPAREHLQASRTPTSWLASTPLPGMEGLSTPAPEGPGSLSSPFPGPASVWEHGLSPSPTFQLLL